MELKTPKEHGIKFNFIMNAILTMSSFVFPLITFPYISRVLGATGNGKVEFAVSVVTYFSMIAQLGIPTYGIRVCAQCRNEKEKLCKTVQELLVINIVLLVVTYILFFICLTTIPRLQEERSLLVITSLNVLLNSIGMNWLFSAFEQYGYITARNLIFKLISIVLMFLAVKSEDNYIVYGAINVFATSGFNVINLIYIRKILGFHLYGNYNFKRHFKPILNFFMLSVAVTVYTGMDKVMLGFICDDAEVGLYSAATKIKAILVSVVTALGTVLLPRISNVIAKKDDHEYIRLIQKSIGFVLLCSIPLTIYFICMADATILFLAGEEYVKSILPMRIIMVTVLLIGLSNITGIQILVPTNREYATTTSTIIGAVINLILNLLLIEKCGAVGAAIATVVAECAVLIYQGVFLGNELRPFMKGIQGGKIIISNMVATIALALIKKIIWKQGEFMQLLVTAFVFFSVYAFMLIVLREKNVIYYITEVKKYFIKSKQIKKLN